MLARPAPRGVLGLLALVLALACGASDPVDPPPPPPPGDRVPLIDGTGLYGGGRSTPPAEHHTRGLQAAAEIRPEAELVVVVVVGMSNAVVEWRAFMERAEGLTNAHLIETACAGCTTELWDEPSDPAYVGAAEKIERSGFDEAGVRVAWIKTAKSTSTAATVADFEAVLSAMRARWPNLEQVFVSSRIYGGYSHVGEPAAYDSGPVLRQFVLNHLGEKDPWVGWGPYLWADGTTPRSDGLRWLPGDFLEDGIHPSEAGAAKVGDLLIEFFETSPYTTWF